jgi:hypothetical protein
VRIGEAIAAGFCGDLVAIAEILTTFSLIYQMRPSSMCIEEVDARLSDALLEGSKDFEARMGRPYEVGLMIAGRRQNGRIELLQLRSPGFAVERIPAPGFAAMGSGEPIVERVAADFIRHMPGTVSFGESTNTGPYALAWQIGAWVQGHLDEHGIDSVGRVLHTLCVEANDVTRVPYEISRLSRLEGESVEFDIIVGTRTGANGEWVQYSGSGGEVVLRNPTELVTDLATFRFDRTISW